MPRNIEIKARLTEDQLARVRSAAMARSSGSPEFIWQRDTFFRVSTGRLKLREFGDGTGELIAYDRADLAGPKTSNYVICPCPGPEAVRDALGRSLGIRGVVEKRRELIQVGQTRVHLDEVTGLGLFMELEVVLSDAQSPEEGTSIAGELMQSLGVTPEGLVDVAYIDLLEARLPASPRAAPHGRVLKPGEGEPFGNGIVVKASPGHGKAGRHDPRDRGRRCRVRAGRGRSPDRQPEG